MIKKEDVKKYVEFERELKRRAEGIDKVIYDKELSIEDFKYSRIYYMLINNTLEGFLILAICLILSYMFMLGNFGITLKLLMISFLSILGMLETSYSLQCWIIKRTYRKEREKCLR